MTRPSRGVRGLRGPSLVLLAAALASAADERTAADIVAEFRAIKIPWSGEMTEEEYTAFVRERCGRQCALALELKTRFPADKTVPELMRLRWTMLLTVFDDPKRVLEEAAAAPTALAVEAALASAHATLETPGAPIAEKLRRVREAAKAAGPRDQVWVAFLLVALARNHIAGPEKQRELCEKVVAECPAAADDARAHLAALERVGKALEIPAGRPLAAASATAAEYTIVHFFGAYDTRVRKDLRELREAVAGLPAGRARIEGVLLYDSEDQVSRAAALALEANATWPVRVAPAGGPDDWYARLRLGQPSFVLLDRERKVVAVTGRAGPLGEALTRLGRPATAD